MELRLIVIRTSNIKRLSDFYSLFGLSFNYHKHGQSPYHYSTTIGALVVEIYPLAKGQEEVDKHLRIGLAIDNFQVTLEKLKGANAQFIMEPTLTEFGYMAVVADPDNRKIELYPKL